jgi:rhombotail lipoprotein
VLRTFSKIGLLAIMLLIVSCAAWSPGWKGKQVGSVVDYLYPDAKEAPKLKEEITYLRPPVKVGVAFVPGGSSNVDLSEVEKQKLLEQIKQAFAQREFIGNIEVIPSSYLRARGGFDNLDQVARMFNVELMALISYDQVQFNDTNALSVLYWTIVGAYVIHGDQYDVQTLVDASVFDVASRKLLFRAPGSSQIKGNASMAGFSEKARAARTEGYRRAVDDLIPQLQVSLDGFKDRIKASTSIKIENKQGYKGGGSVNWAWLSFVVLLGWIGIGRRLKA